MSRVQLESANWKISDAARLFVPERYVVIYEDVPKKRRINARTFLINQLRMSYSCYRDEAYTYVT